MGAIASLIFAQVLTVTSAPSWDISVPRAGAQPPRHVDVQLKNNGRTTLLWNLDHMPAWVRCPLDPARPELGQRLTGAIPRGGTQTVRFQYIGQVPSGFTMPRYVDDISFSAVGLSQKEVGIDCWLRITE